jgi:hypothetical protein
MVIALERARAQRSGTRARAQRSGTRTRARIRISQPHHQPRRASVWLRFA